MYFSNRAINSSCLKNLFKFILLIFVLQSSATPIQMKCDQVFALIMMILCFFGFPASFIFFGLVLMVQNKRHVGFYRACIIFLVFLILCYITAMVGYAIATVKYGQFNALFFWLNCGVCTGNWLWFMNFFGHIAFFSREYAIAYGIHTLLHIVALFIFCSGRNKMKKEQEEYKSKMNSAVQLSSMMPVKKSKNPYDNPLSPSHSQTQY